MTTHKHLQKEENYLEILHHLHNQMEMKFHNKQIFQEGLQLKILILKEI